MHTQKDFAGLIVPLVTPLTAAGSLDRAALERLINHVVKGGVDGVFLLGPTGEAPSLSSAVKMEMIRYTQLFLDGRAKSLVGITDTAPDETVFLGRAADKHGADAVVVAPPPYFPFTPQELTDYTRRVVRQLPLPVMLYNIPRMTKIGFTPEVVAALTDEPSIAGLKDSSRDMQYLESVLKVAAVRPDWSVLTGFEDLLVQSMRLGADGGVLGGANVFPALLSRFYQAIVGKDEAKIDILDRTLQTVRSMYTLGKGSVPGIQAIKYALELKGICSRHMAFPFAALDDESGKLLQQLLAMSAPNEKESS